MTDADLCVETFGDAADPPVLLIGNSMLTWPDEFCERLAAGGRRPIRYDLRDTGLSTTVNPDAPAYTLRDLVADAAGLIDARTHVVGYTVGGWIAQLLALDRPELVATLTLISTRPTAPGPNDPDLPEHAPEVMAHFMSAPAPNWSDRAAVIEASVEVAKLMAGSRGFVEADVRANAARIFDRVGPDPAVQRSNHLGTVFAALDSKPRWRERLGQIAAPTLVMHGAQDPFFPVGNAEALAKEIPGAQLRVLDGIGQAMVRPAWPELLEGILWNTARS
jgi:pimeloyl-ACP methyl ester carboxylesterase